MDANTRLISRRELAAKLGISRVTVWRWLRDGRFPRPVTVNGLLRWRSTEVDAWLADLPRANAQLTMRSKLPETQRNDPKRRKANRLRIIAENGNGV